MGEKKRWLEAKFDRIDIENVTVNVNLLFLIIIHLANNESRIKLRIFSSQDLHSFVRVRTVTELFSLGVNYRLINLVLLNG